MILISHRGNILGKNKNTENTKDQIEYCINIGYDVEIDIRYIDNQWFLGHDEPQYTIDIEWIYSLKNKLWVHCKNLNALSQCHKYSLNYFWHDTDDYTLTSNGIIWSYPGKPIKNNIICVLPEQSIIEYTKQDLGSCYGICSDNIEYYKNLLF